MAGIYIHIPFCKQACTYCNFHFSTLLEQKSSVLAALRQEINMTQHMAADEVIDTIYLGGGTPSILHSEEIAAIFTTLQQKFTINPAVEITLEANPDDISTAVLKNWKSINVNRLSLGVQSFQEDELKWMNRAHHAGQSLQSIQDIIAAGYTNFSVDLIYGSPLLSNDDFKKNVQIILDKNIPHVSAYALTVEPSTVLHALINRKKSPPVDEGRQAEQFDILVSMMEVAGYEHYEISNFAKPGFRSRHNSSYWQGKPYYGFGPSAHSFNGNNTRRWNISNNALYQKSIENNSLPFEEEILTETQQLNEYVMISLRTMEGIDLNLVERRFGRPNMEALIAKAQTFVSQQLLAHTSEHLLLTKKGKFLADGIAADLFF